MILLLKGGFFQKKKGVTRFAGLGDGIRQEGGRKLRHSERIKLQHPKFKY